MEKEIKNHAEQLLEQIFLYMSELVNEKDFSRTLILLTELGKSLVGSERASFWYWDQKMHQYWTLAALGRDKICVPEGTGIVGASISKQENIVINNPYEDERFNPSVDRETGFVTRSILCIPVTNERGKVIGAFQAINKQNEQGEFCGFEDADVRRLAMVAVFCGKTLESHLLYDQALVDQLTGLKNRRGFYDYYREYEENRPECGTLVMCDIDFFKKVNDTYGHNAGDAVLMYVADCLSRNLAIGDEVVRWGGEEFIFILRNRGVEEAVAFAEQVRGEIMHSVITYEGQQIQITMSFGVAPIDENWSSDENIKRADEHLYQAKQTGRNKVVAWKE